MNIAAAMTALEVAGLDARAKHALLAVCCRANRHTGKAWVATGRIADDMGVSRNTASRALDRLVAAGYLNVDKSCGKRPCWQLTCSIWVPQPASSFEAAPASSFDAPKDVLEKDKGRGGAHADGENPNLSDDQRHALDPANIKACPYCDEFGWLWRGDVIRARCTHHPVVSDLTVDDILDPA